jgi:hypothetical protein
MLVKDRVTAGCCIKECTAKIAVNKQHGDGSRKNRKGEQQQECRDQH